MTDCVFAYIGICDCDTSCSGCKNHISANDEKGDAIIEEYQEDVDEALIPVKKKWKEKFKELN